MTKGILGGEAKDVSIRDEGFYADVGKPGGYGGPHAFGLLPVRKMVGWMIDDENRDFLSEVIAAGRRAFRMLPVHSNAELLQRIEEYFSIVQGRRVPPTVEEFALYLGMSVSSMYDVLHGSKSGFPDTETYGTSSEIIKKALDVLHSADAIQAMKKLSDNAVYIFRSKNYYNMEDKREVPVTITYETPAALPPEQIAKMLPDMTADRSMDGVEVI